MGGVLAQTAATAATPPKPAALVYVGSGTHIYGYSAAVNGKLTAAPGSPFNYSLSLMGANGYFLFGFVPNTVTIESFSMASNGVLKKAATTNTQTYESSTCSPLTYWNGQGLRIDHSGSSLYNAAIPEDAYCYSKFQSFKINSANGTLSPLGETDKIFFGGASLSLLGNNKFAYSPTCVYPFGNSGSPEITAFQRLSSGELVTAKAGVPIPPAPVDTSNTDSGGPYTGYYCPNGGIATDPTNHVAMTFYAIDSDDNANYGPAVIATYTADANGNLTTTSTYKNMATLPTAADATCLACATLRMAPSGKLLAAGGIGGVALFHFNGGSPATKYKTLLTTESISQIVWDNNDHMYAVGSDAKGGKLWVYTVTPTSVTEAPGSPYSIPNAAGIVVQPFK
jgi:hypothetical protein